MSKRKDWRGVVKRTFLAYDKGASVHDRYTVLLLGPGWHPVLNSENKWQWTALSLSDDLSFAQWKEVVRGKHLGRAVDFNTLPENVQTFIHQHFDE